MLRAVKDALHRFRFISLVLFVFLCVINVLRGAGFFAGVFSSLLITIIITAVLTVGSINMGAGEDNG